MLKSIICEGKTSNEAIEKGLKKLKVQKNQVDIKIIEEKKKSFFNILDPHVVKVELTLKEKDDKKLEKKEIIEKKKEKIEEIKPENIEEAKKRIEIFLGEFLVKISDKIEYNTKIENDTIYIDITGEKAEKLIGYRGEALNSLQTIISTIANKEIDSNVKIILDIINYKEARKKILEELSEKIEKTVKKTGKSVTLEPMTPYERKIIHTKLQESEVVKTYSIGECDRRRVVIAKK